MKVILISGHAQNGKDTAAGFIKKYLEDHGERVQIMHYADLLKFICKEYFGWNGLKDERGRKMLQHVGTDVIRRRYPDFWVEWLTSLIEALSYEWDYVIIPDTRFPNEVDLMKDMYDECWHIRVVRPWFESPLTEEQRSHPSETALDDYEPDFMLYNDGTLDDLKGESIELTRRIMQE